MTHEERFVILTAHAEKLRATKTFEEYKEAHIAYIEYLISRFDLDEQAEKLMHEYVDVPNANPS